MNIFEQLKQEALSAQRCFSTELLYQTCGESRMALALGEITASEDAEIRALTIGFMATDPGYIRHRNLDIINTARYLSLRKGVDA